MIGNGRISQMSGQINEQSNTIKGRVSKITNYINTIRNASEIGEGVTVKTEQVIAYMQKQENLDRMYDVIATDTKEMKKIQREKADRQIRDARNDFADLGIGEIY